MELTGKNYIGNTLSGKGGIFFKTINPIKNIKNKTKFIEATEDEVKLAISLASESFNNYKEIPGIERSLFLKTIGDEIMKLGDDLIKIYCQESGLPEPRAIGERSRTINQLNSFANLIENEKWRENFIDIADPNRKPLPKPDLRKTSVALGPVVVFGASNFPLAFSTAGGDTASALASGCPVIVKSHPMHCGTSELISKAIINAIIKTKMPNGIFSNLNSKGFEVGQKLVMDSKIKAVGFTGSFKGGKFLFDMVSKRKEPIPFFAEMGSVNPIIILPSSIKEKSEDLVKNLIASISLGAGQFCTNPGIIFTIDDENTNNFITKIADKIKDVQNQCMLHPNMKSNYENRSESIIKTKNVGSLKNEKLIPENNFVNTKIAIVSLNDFLENSEFREEVFGPFSVIVKCKNLSELLSGLNRLSGQLTATIHSEKEDYNKVNSIINILKNKVGRILFNDFPTGVELSRSMTHGGPFPASTDSRYSSVGLESIKRWIRPISYQNFPKEFLPSFLK